MTVAITRDELGAGHLRREAVRCREANAARRMLALAPRQPMAAALRVGSSALPMMVLEGRSRQEAARNAGMDRQTMRDWVHRYNSLPSGLTS